MTTTIESQITSGKAESIHDDHKFQILLDEYVNAAIAHSHEYAEWADANKAYKAVIAHIDALIQRQREITVTVSPASDLSKLTRFAEQPDYSGGCFVVPREDGDYVSFVDVAALIAHIEAVREKDRGELIELKKINMSLLNEVHEWLCDTCATVFPGPPQKGFHCVICPKCNGTTGPRVTMEKRKAEAALAAANDVALSMQAEIDGMRKRAEKAEAELKAIAERQAPDPDDLTRYTPAVDPEFGNAYCTPNPKGGFLRFADVKLLLAPAQQEPSKDPAQCWCATCRPVTPFGNPEDNRMVLCPTCGNKRCPHANDHRNACTNSNEPGQPGSGYPAANLVSAGLRLRGKASPEFLAAHKDAMIYGTGIMMGGKHVPYAEFTKQDVQEVMAQAAQNELTLGYCANVAKKHVTENANKTPLYVEDLIKILDNSHTYAVAGYMGATERVISHEGLLNALRAMKNESD